MLGISMLNTRGYCVIYNSSLTLYRVHTLQDSLPFWLVRNQEGFNRMKRVLSRYRGGFEFLSKLFDNLQFPSKAILMDEKNVS